MSPAVARLADFYCAVRGAAEMGAPFGNQSLVCSGHLKLPACFPVVFSVEL
jgi:hypothetical protein